MEKKIKKVTLEQKYNSPSHWIREGTEGKKFNGENYMFEGSNGINECWGIDYIREHPEWFKIEYETPKIKLVAVKLQKYNEEMFMDNLCSSFDIDYILSHPQYFIIEYEEESNVT